MKQHASAAVSSARIIPVSAGEYVGAMRGVVSGVSIITTWHEGRPWGMTVSAFTSVCAEPPTLLVCVNNRTVLAEALSGNGRFGVNVLSQDQEFLSRMCAKPGTPKYLDSYSHPGAYDSGEMGAPLLHDSVAAFDCELIDSRTVGTHMVVMGAVADVVTSPRPPLLYGAGSYHGPASFAPHSFLDRALSWT